MRPQILIKCLIALTRSGVFCLPLLFSVSAQAQGVALGPGMRLEATVEGQTAYTDNFYRTNTNEEDAWSYLLLPGMELTYRQDTGGVRVGYAGEMAEHDTRSKDDYFDHKLYLESDYRPMTRHEFRFNFDYLDEHDELGTSRTSGLQAVNNRELDQWTRVNAQARYTYGAPTARFNWHIRGLIRDKEYDTNRVDTQNPAAGTRFLDHSANGFGAGMVISISPRTKAVFDLEHREIAYDVDSNPSFDGEFQRYLLGVRWQATAKTTGEFLVGQYERSFDDSARNDVDNFSWEARVTWAPVNYSTFQLKTGRTAYENFQLGEDFVESDYFELVWRHDWRSTIHTEIGGNISDFNFEGTNPQREDENTAWFANLEVEVAPRYLISFGYTLHERDSSIAAAQYDRNSGVISLKATF